MLIMMMMMIQNSNSITDPKWQNDVEAELEGVQDLYNIEDKTKEIKEELKLLVAKNDSIKLITQSLLRLQS